MATPFTRRIAAGGLIDTAGLLVYTVPPGLVVVVRDVTMTVRQPDNAQLYVRTSQGLVYTIWNGSGLASSSLHLDLRQSLNAGDEVYVQGPAGMQYAITAYLLTA